MSRRDLLANERWASSGNCAADPSPANERRRNGGTRDGHATKKKGLSHLRICLRASRQRASEEHSLCLVSESPPRLGNERTMSSRPILCLLGHAVLVRACSASSNIFASAAHGAAQEENYLARKKKNCKGQGEGHCAGGTGQTPQRCGGARWLCGAGGVVGRRCGGAARAEAPAAAMGSGVAEGAAEGGGVTAAMRARFNRSIMQAAAGDDENLVAVKAFARQIKKSRLALEKTSSCKNW